MGKTPDYHHHKSKELMYRMDALLQDDHCSRNELVENIRFEFGGTKIHEDYNEGMYAFPQISNEIENIIHNAGKHSGAYDSNLVKNVIGMEQSFKEKCGEIKRLKLLIMKLS